MYTNVVFRGSNSALFIEVSIFYGVLIKAFYCNPLRPFSVEGLDSRPGTEGTYM